MKKNTRMKLAFHSGVPLGIHITAFIGSHCGILSPCRILHAKGGLLGDVLPYCLMIANLAAGRSALLNTAGPKYPQYLR